MQTAVLTDAETNEQVLVVFGEGGAVFAKTNKDDAGSYTEIFDADQEQMIAVKETPSDIKKRLS